MIRKGSKVSWKWGNDTAEGTVKETFDEKVERTIKGSKITRKGTSVDKALLIEQADGDEVLKLASEVDHQK